MKHAITLTLLSAILLTTLSAFAHPDPPARAAQSAINKPDWVPIECPMEVPTRYQVECGMVTMPEDHSSPDGPSIQLAVAVVHSSGGTPASDPLLFINGGPGARTLDSMSLWLETFSLGPLLIQRDIIFFDQRGTGYSQPALVCPESPSANPLVALQDAASLTACRDRLAKSGINLGAYTSVQNAADISVLREALGYDRWNLYGVSYGTRIALTTLRDHPEGVRSIILDAITPIEANLLLEDPVYAQRALHHLFAACRTDPVCRTAYPDVERVYDELVDELAQNPISLKITNPNTGQTKVEKYNGTMLNGTILGMLGSPEAAGIPGLIYELRAGNYSPIIADLESAWEAEKTAAVKPAPVGAQLAVICGEEAPFVAREEMAQVLDAHPPETNFLTVIDSTFYTACQVWGLGPAEPTKNAPVGSDVPVLILAGEYDTARPPDEARRAAEPLTNSTVVEFPGAGHAVALAGTCPLDVMAQFLDDPTTPPDTHCTTRMGAPHFFVSISLTRPFARAMAVVAGIAGLAIAVCAGAGLAQMAIRRRIPWRVTLYRVGWLPLAITALATAALYWIWLTGILDLRYFYKRSLAQVAVMVGPLVVSIQTAFFFASEDKPALEVTLACPRSFHWLPVERTAVALLGQILIAVATVAVGAWGLEEQLPIAQPLAVLWWLCSTLLLSGLAAFTSTRSRRAMVGILLAVLTWLVFGIASSDQFDNVLLPPAPLGFHFGWPRPFDVIQPFLWLIHPFLRPGSVSTGDFILNRIIVGGLGLVLMALAAKRLADPEHVLLGTAARSSRAGSRALSRRGRRSRRKPLTAFAQIKDVRMAQLWTIARYEMLMSWRRGSLRAILISILLLPQLFHIIACLFGSMLDEALIASLADRPEVLLMAGTNAALVSNTTTMIMIILMLPLMVTEIIPLDRQHRVREVIDALPVTKGLYVASKLLSVWPVILIGLCISAVLNGLVSWALNGPFQIETVALFWLTGLIPLALFGSQMGVMFAAGQPNRRRAVRTGLLAFVATLAASFALPVNQFFAAGVFQLALNMAAIDDLRVSAAIPSFPDMLSLNIWLRIGGVMLMMVGVWFCTVKLLQRRHTARSQEALQ